MAARCGARPRPGRESVDVTPSIGATAGCKAGHVASSSSNRGRPGVDHQAPGRVQASGEAEMQPMRSREMPEGYKATINSTGPSRDGLPEEAEETGLKRRSVVTTEGGHGNGAFPNVNGGRRGGRHSLLQCNHNLSDRAQDLMLQTLLQRRIGLAVVARPLVGCVAWRG
jgi:hypothetical protein